MSKSQDSMHQEHIQALAIQARILATKELRRSAGESEIDSLASSLLSKAAVLAVKKPETKD